MISYFLKLLWCGYGVIFRTRNQLLEWSGSDARRLNHINSSSEIIRLLKECHSAGFYTVL